MGKTEIPRFARDDNDKLSFSRNIGLIFPCHLHACVEHDSLHVQRSVGKGELIGILELNRNPTCGRAGASGQSVGELHIVEDTNLRSGAGHLAARGSETSARGATSAEVLYLSWIEAGGLEGLSDLGGNLIRGQRDVWAATGSAGLRHGRSRALTGGVIDGGIDVEGAAEPVDAQHDHKKNGYHQGGFGDL